MSSFDGFAPPAASFTPAPNQFFDEVVGHHPACVVSVVAILIRATLGWENRHTGERRVEAELPLSAFVRPELSRTSARAGLTQAIEAGLVVRTGEPTNRSGGRYALRWRDASAQQEALARERRAGAVNGPTARLPDAGPSDDCPSEDCPSEDCPCEDCPAMGGGTWGRAEAEAGGEGAGDDLRLPAGDGPAGQTGLNGSGAGWLDVAWSDLGGMKPGRLASRRPEAGPPDSAPPLQERSKKERNSESTLNAQVDSFQQRDPERDSAPDRQARRLPGGRGGAEQGQWRPGERRPGERRPGERRPGEGGQAPPGAYGAAAAPPGVFWDAGLPSETFGAVDAPACGGAAGAGKPDAADVPWPHPAGVPWPDAPVDPNPAAARRERIVEQLVAELSDRGSERRHRQLLDACDRRGLYGLPQEALRATRRRLDQQGRLGVLERPGAYYQRILLGLMEDHQVFVPAGRPGEREEVRRLARMSLGMAGGGPPPAGAPPGFDPGPWPS